MLDTPPHEPKPDSVKDLADLDKLLHDMSKLPPDEDFAASGDGKSVEDVVSRVDDASDEYFDTSRLDEPGLPDADTSAPESGLKGVTKEQYFAKGRSILLKILIDRGLDEDKANRVLELSLDKEFAAEPISYEAVERIVKNLNQITVAADVVSDAIAPDITPDAPDIDAADIDTPPVPTPAEITTELDNEALAVAEQERAELQKTTDDTIAKLDEARTSLLDTNDPAHASLTQSLHTQAEKLRVLQARLINLPTWETDARLLAQQQGKTTADLQANIQHATRAHEAAAKLLETKAAGFKKSFGEEYAAVRNEMMLDVDPVILDAAPSKKTGWWDKEYHPTTTNTLDTEPLVLREPVDPVDTTPVGSEVLSESAPASEAQEGLEAEFTQAVQRHIHNLRLLLEAEGKGPLRSPVTSGNPPRIEDIARWIEASEKKYKRSQETLSDAGVTDLVSWGDEQIAALEVKLGWRKKPSLFGRLSKRFSKK